jgi:hypothetical protein
VQATSNVPVLIGITTGLPGPWRCEW